VKKTPSPARPPDDQLAAVLAAWPTLPEAIRARIVGIVEGAGMGGSGHV
jgi:hypothetical protein